MSDLEERKQACIELIKQGVSIDQINEIIHVLNDPHGIAIEQIRKADKRDLEIIEGILDIEE